MKKCRVRMSLNMLELLSKDTFSDVFLDLQNRNFTANANLGSIINML